jgi:hypothetical protein
VGDQPDTPPVLTCRQEWRQPRALRDAENWIANEAQNRAMRRVRRLRLTLLLQLDSHLNAMHKHVCYDMVSCNEVGAAND